jgi:hypothetical protein
MNTRFDPHLVERCPRPHELVPRDYDDNIFWRRDLFGWLTDEGKVAQNLLRDWCRRDVMFYADALCFTLDPKRHPGAPLRPWITLPFQEEVFLGIEDALGAVGSTPGEIDQAGHDLVLLKSRDMGCSYIALICIDRRFLLYDHQVFEFVSSSEELVDKRSNPNSLFPKMDIIHSQLPPFMLEGSRRNKLQFSRPGAFSIMDGMATTPNVTRSSRPHAIIADEFGAWPVNASLDFSAASIGASNCRMFISTSHGIGNGFHEVATNPDIPQIRLHWTQHPWHREGQYRSLGEGGELEYQDQAFWPTERPDWLQKKYPLLARKMKPAVNGNELLRDRYPFVKDGRIRSPFYDEFCLRAKFRWIPAQELDMDFLGSGSPFYDHAGIQDLIDRQTQVPFKQGDLAWDAFTFEPTGFEEREDGPLSLWINLSLQGPSLCPPVRRYQIGVDVGAGTGASESAISVWDLVSREKVASYVRSDLRPERFAEAAFAVGRWFGGCQIVAEGQGAGKDFHARLKDLGYSSLFYMFNAKGVRSEFPGLFTEGGAKESLLVEYGRALLDGEAVCRDAAAIKEALNFQLNKEGRAEHVATLSAKNPGGSKKNHGDRWMADCLAWFRVKRFKRFDRHEIPKQDARVVSDTERWATEAEEDRRYARSRW